MGPDDYIFQRWGKEEDRYAFEVAARILREEAKPHISSDTPPLPVQLEPYLNARRVKIEHASSKNTDKDTLPTLRMIMPREGGFLLPIHVDFTKLVKRFSIAHELGHTLFFSLDRIYPKRAFHYYRSEEKLCDQIARALLIPREQLSSMEDSLERLTSPEPDSKEQVSTAFSSIVKKVHEIFQVPLWRFFERLHDIQSPIWSRMVLIRWKLSDDQDESNQGILYTAASIKKRGIYIPLKKRSREKSIKKGIQQPRKIWLSGESSFDICPIDLGTIRGRFPIFTMRVDESRKKGGFYVLQMIWVDVEKLIKPRWKQQ